MRSSPPIQRPCLPSLEQHASRFETAIAFGDALNSPPKRLSLLSARYNVNIQVFVYCMMTLTCGAVSSGRISRKELRLKLNGICSCVQPDRVVKSGQGYDWRARWPRPTSSPWTRISPHSLRPSRIYSSVCAARYARLYPLQRKSSHIRYRPTNCMAAPCFTLQDGRSTTRFILLARISSRHSRMSLLLMRSTTRAQSVFHWPSLSP